jgi:hypothetical protein
MGCCENNSLKALIIVNHSHRFDSKLNRFYTPFADGLLQEQLFKSTDSCESFLFHHLWVGYFRVALLITRFWSGLSVDSTLKHA